MKVQRDGVSKSLDESHLSTNSQRRQGAHCLHRLPFRLSVVVGRVRGSNSLTECPSIDRVLSSFSCWQSSDHFSSGSSQLQPWQRLHVSVSGMYQMLVAATITVNASPSSFSSSAVRMCTSSCLARNEGSKVKSCCLRAATATKSAYQVLQIGSLFIATTASKVGSLHPLVPGMCS